MSFSVTNGYSPRSYETILTQCVQIVNEQFGTSYNNQSFVGTNLWKFLYTTIQGLMTVENNIAELGVKLQDYIRTQNEELLIPRSSVDGFMKATEEELGLISSIRPIERSQDAGQMYVAVDVDPSRTDYAEIKQKILDLEHECLTAGLFYHGTETGTVTASNGQVFNYAYELPAETALQVKIQVTVSENNNLFVETPVTIKEKFLENFKELYRLGYDFEPQQFLNISRDLPFASQISIQYKTSGSWQSGIMQGVYDEKITINPDNVTVEVL